MTLNHVHIGTKDIAKSVRFYSELFNFKKKFDHGNGVFLESKDSNFLLAIDPVDEVPNLPSWFHLGFCLDSENKVLKLYEESKKLDVKIARDMMKKDGEFASFFILDPDGYKIEISWHNE